MGICVLSGTKLTSYLVNTMPATVMNINCANHSQYCCGVSKYIPMSHNCCIQVNLRKAIHTVATCRYHH